MLAPEIELLLRIIDEGYNKKAWHGPNLRGAIKRVAFAQAEWRPAPGRHNIWEHIVDCSARVTSIEQAPASSRRTSATLCRPADFGIVLPGPCSSSPDWLTVGCKHWNSRPAQSLPDTTAVGAPRQYVVTRMFRPVSPRLCKFSGVTADTDFGFSGPIGWI